MHYFESPKKKTGDSEDEEEGEKKEEKINLFGCSMNRSKEIELFEKTNEQKMSLFQEYKQLGNQAFKEKDLE